MVLLIAVDETESCACNSTHLVRQGIFQRPAPGLVHFKPCLSFSPQKRLLLVPKTYSCYNTALGPQPSWPGRGARPEDGKTLPGEHSCARTVT